MQTLEKTIRRGGFELRQWKRHGDVAIYEQLSGGIVVAYEVIRIQHQPAQVIFNKEYPEREVYPSSEQWGLNGWTCMTRERATERFYGLQGEEVPS